MNTLSSLWGKTLFTLSGGNPVTLGDVLLVLLLLLGSYFLIVLLQFVVARRLKSSNLRPDSIVAVKRVSFYVIFTLVAFTVLGILGIPITIFAFATGAIAIGIGFGAQNIINNFISGWILMAERPIRLDDLIELDGAYGRVEQVGTRSTRIRRSDGVHMLVPNSMLLENTVVNWTLIDQRIRTTLRVGVSYSSDPAQVGKLLEQIVTAHTAVLADPQPEFIFEDFGDSALIFDCYFWSDVAGERTLRSIRSDIRYEISSVFKDEGIEISFPQRDIHLHASKPIAVKMEQGG